MQSELNTDVLIVGAGPVGLTLAMDLDFRGVNVLIVETRRYMEPPSVKCNHVSARTMEQYRRLGIVQKLRSLGLPPDFPNDVVFRTSVTGVEFARIPIPGRATRYTDTAGPDGWWPTPEPPHRINQIYLEPALLEHAASLPHVTLLNETEAQHYVEHPDHVELVVRDVNTGALRSLRARFLVGCDGGKSTIRRQMGVTLSGHAVVQNVQSTYIRAPKLLERIPGKLAWGTYAVNPRRCGTVFAIDGRETWLIHNHLNPGEDDFDSVDRDWSIRTILGVDDDFEYEIITKEDWVGRRLVADQFRKGRVFICGDAAHLWVPYAGYGMNAGIADAMNLSWHLAAYLNGWAHENILNAYQMERQPITEQVSYFAMNHAQKMIAARKAVPHDIEDPGPEGEAVRARVGKEAYDLNVQQFCAAGLNFGYFYDNSPLIVYDGEPAPPYTMGDFTPSTAPGCRAPHFWLPDGSSLYDAFGPDYTLLRFDPTVDINPLLNAATRSGVPLTVLDLPSAGHPAEYRHRLVLCRADQHVAWRGDEPPADPDALMQRLRGVHAYDDGH